MQTQPAFSQDNKKCPLISFVITYYNEPEELLQKCIETITTLDLEEDEREIILVDDGSERSPLESLGDSANQLIYIRQPNKGLSQARNMGIELATGKYIQFIDADDYLLQGYYEQCIDIAKQKDADMVLFHETDKEQKTESINIEGPLTGTEFMHNHNLRASACGYFFKRNLLVNLRFTKDILHEDEEFTPQLVLRTEQIYNTNAKAYYYRKRKESITHKNDKKWKDKRLQDAEQTICKLNDKADQLPSKERTALQRRVAQLTMDYIYNIITLTHDAQTLETAITRLRKRGLFPLPNKNYTRKYRIFRMFANKKLGRKLMLALLR